MSTIVNNGVGNSGHFDAVRETRNCDLVVFEIK
jgi:hypothetical protein